MKKLISSCKIIKLDKLKGYIKRLLGFITYLYLQEFDKLLTFYLVYHDKILNDFIIHFIVV